MHLLPYRNPWTIERNRDVTQNRYPSLNRYYSPPLLSHHHHHYHHPLQHSLRSIDLLRPRSPPIHHPEGWRKKRERERERERERALVAVNDFHYARAYSLVYIIYNTLREAHRWGTKRTARCVEGQWARKSGRKILLQSRLAARWRRIKLRPLLVIRLCNTRICKERCVARF